MPNTIASTSNSSKVEGTRKRRRSVPVQPASSTSNRHSVSGKKQVPKSGNAPNLNRFLHIVRSLVSKGHQEYNIQGVSRPLWDLEDQVPTWPKCKDATGPAWTCETPVVARVSYGLRERGKKTAFDVSVLASYGGKSPSDVTPLVMEPYKEEYSAYVHDIIGMLKTLAGYINRADELFTFYRVVFNPNILGIAMNISIKSDFQAYVKYLSAFLDEYERIY